MKKRIIRVAVDKDGIWVDIDSHGVSGEDMAAILGSLLVVVAQKSGVEVEQFMGMVADEVEKLKGQSLEDLVLDARWR